MPKGRKKTHKGGHRHFTNEEQMAHNSEKVRKEREWRKQRGLLDSDEEDEDDEKKDDAAGGATAAAVARERKDSGSETDSSDEDGEERHKGIEHLIEVENPNRVQRKTKKVSELEKEGAGAKTELSRREREELEKQQSKERYLKMHMAGKTDEARADLARLALIRKQREEAAKKKEEEKLAKERAKAKK